MNSSAESSSEDPGFAELRQRMVEEQLRARGIHDERVLAAMEQVPRHRFVPPSQTGAAYEDTPLPIGHGQTISQPFTVAFLCEALQVNPSDKVLDVGTGSGYGAAVLAHLARRVYTLDRLAALVETARERLAQLGYDNVEVRHADGTLGWPEAAPFDAILVAAGGNELPPAYREQLAEGGRVVIPLGLRSFRQVLVRFTLHDGKLEREELGPFAFVPLIGEQGWSTQDIEEGF